MAPDHKWRAMVVDDDQTLLNALVEILSTEFEVVAAVNGLDALEKLERYEPDLIILDVVMPCVDGIDTCRALRKNVKFRDIPVIFLSGQDETQYLDRAKGLQNTRFLRKPVEPIHLLELCTSVMQQSDSGDAPPTKRFSLTELETLDMQRTPTPRVPLQRTEAIDAKISLPLTEAKVSEPPLQASTARVMVVDDDHDIISYMLAVLRERYEAFGVRDPVSAIYKIIRYQPDLIILDIAMPRMSGYQLSQLLRLNRNLRTIKFMFVSSKDNPQEIAYAKKLGAADYLVKPFSAEELMNRVTSIVDAPDLIVREKALSFQDIRNIESADSSPSQFQ